MQQIRRSGQSLLIYQYRQLGTVVLSIESIPVLKLHRNEK